MGPQEQAVVDRLQGLGMNQADAITAVMEMARQPQGSMLLGLQGSDRDLLDQAFAGAETGLRHQANLLGQDMASTRGLNRSDTPVAGAIAQLFLPALASLQSQKAAQSLGLGLNLGQLNEGRRQFNINALLAGGTAMPSALAGLANRFQQERFAGAKTVGTSRGTQTPSLMQSIGQGIGLVGQLGSLGMGIAGAGSGGGGIPVGGLAGGLGSGQGFAQPTGLQYNAPIGPMRPY